MKDIQKTPALQLFATSGMNPQFFVRFGIHWQTSPRNPIRVGIPQVFHSIRARALQVPGGWASRQNKWFAWEPLPQGWSHSCSLLPTSNISEPFVIFHHHLFIRRLQTVHQVGKEMAPPLPRERLDSPIFVRNPPGFSLLLGQSPTMPWREGKENTLLLFESP